MALYSLAFIIHLLIWKVRVPKNQTKILLEVFMLTLVVGYAIFLSFPPYFLLFSLTVPNSVKEYLHISIFYLSLMLAYIVFYSAIEADSPSLGIIRKIYGAGVNGAKKEDLYQTFVGMPFLESRIRNLIEDRLISIRDERFSLTKRGRVLLYVISFYRYLFDLQKGG